MPPEKTSSDTPCYCGTAKSYATCCAPYHAGLAAPSAEALMRSRYSAYVLGLEAYLLSTWHPSTRPQSLDLDAEPKARWLGLTVKRQEMTGDGMAQVEFVARYKIAGRAHRLHEISRFELSRDDGRWLYLDGEGS